MKINYIDQLEIMIDQNKYQYVEEIEVMKPPPDKPDEKPVKTIERRYTYDFCDILKAYQNLCKASQMIEKKCKFSYSDKLGYLTSLPRDLGYFEMNILLEMPILWKMINSVDEIEDFAHYGILEKYKVDLTLFENEGYLELRPRVISYRRVNRAHNLQMESFDEPILCNRRLSRRHSNTLCQNSYKPKYHDIKKDEGFSRFNKNEKIMAQDMISCVKELTD